MTLFLKGPQVIVITPARKFRHRAEHLKTRSSCKYRPDLKRENESIPQNVVLFFLREDWYFSYKPVIKTDTGLKPKLLSSLLFTQ